MTEIKTKPPRGRCWYALLRRWEGEPCLATWGKRCTPILATYDEWLESGVKSEELILFGDVPHTITRAGWLLGQGVPIAGIRRPQVRPRLPEGQSLSVRLFHSWLLFRSACSRREVWNWFRCYWLPRQCWFTVGEDLRWPWRIVYGWSRRILEAIR